MLAILREAGAAGLIALVAVSACIIIYWRWVLIEHQMRLRQLQVRVHVNGIRGKSTVTRLVASVLREGGFITVAKTTGSAARVIGPAGEEDRIFRRGAATINEQIDIVREYITPDVEALVIECMAVKPLYQQYSQELMVKSDITIITNVREDHQEEMGETLEQIADSLSVTIPPGGILITAEERPDLQERLRRNAEARGCSFVYADAASVTDDEMRGFHYLQFKSNVATGLAVAEILGIDRTVALRGMWKCLPDVGVVTLEHYDIEGKDVLWVPLFAANDRESVVMTLDLLRSYYKSEVTVIGILNNRWDRGRRAELFARMVPVDLSDYLDHVITFGAFERQVSAKMLELGYPPDRVTNLGETVSPSLDTILETVASLIPGRHGVLIGLVNIHTEQAEMLLEHFRQLRGGCDDSDLALSRDPRHMPIAAQRLRLVQALVAHRATKSNRSGEVEA